MTPEAINHLICHGKSMVFRVLIVIYNILSSVFVITSLMITSLAAQITKSIEICSNQSSPQTENAGTSESSSIKEEFLNENVFDISTATKIGEIKNIGPKMEIRFDIRISNMAAPVDAHTYLLFVQPWLQFRSGLSRRLETSIEKGR